MNFPSILFAAAILPAEGLTQSLATIQGPLMNRTFGGSMSGSGMTRDGAQKLVRSNATAFDLAIDVHAGVYPAVANRKTDLEALATARAVRDAAADQAASGLPSTGNQSVEVLLTRILLGSGRLYTRVQAQGDKRVCHVRCDKPLPAHFNG